MKFGLLIFCLMCLYPAISIAADTITQKSAANLTAPPATNTPITNAQLQKYFDDCVYKIPPRFTPDAREYYCGCTMTNIKAQKFTQSDLDTLKNKKNWIAANPTFERFASKVMAPCLDQPVKQIEYLSCLLSSETDYNMHSPPQFCSCYSTKMKKHASKFAAPEMLLQLGSKNNFYRDPLDALWANRDYVRATLTAREDCIIGR